MVEAFTNTVRNFISSYQGNASQFDILKAILEFLYLKKNNDLDVEKIKSSDNLHDDIGLSLSTQKLFSEKDLNNHFAIELMKRIEGFIIRKEEYGVLADGLIKSYNDSQHKHSSLHQTPKEIIQLMLSLGIQQKNKVNYNPFTGLSSFSIYDKSDSYYYLEDINKEVIDLTVLRITLHDSENKSILQKNDSIINWNPTKLKYDEIFCVPPFGVNVNLANSKKISINKFIINASLESLKADGKLIFTLNNDFLIKSGDESEFRKSLLKNGHIETVISFPKNLLSYSSIPFSVLVVRKKQIKNAKVKFIYVSDEYVRKGKFQNILDLDKIQTFISNQNRDVVREVSIEVIEKNNFSLYPPQYFEDLALVKKEESLLVSLSYVIDLLSLKRNNGTTEKCISMKNLSKAFHSSMLYYEHIDSTDNAKHYKVLNEKALLINSIGEELMPNYYNSDEKILVSSNIFAFRYDSTKVLLDYLLIELRKPYIKDQLNLKNTTTFTRIQSRDLFHLKIELPSLDEQKKAVDEFKTNLIQLERIKVKNLEQQIGLEVADANSFLTHKIAGRLKNLRFAVKESRNIIESNGSGLLKTKLDPNGFDLEKYLDILQRDIQYISNSVIESQKISNLKKVEKEEFCIIDFIVSYSKEQKDKFRGSDIAFDYEIDIETVESPKEIIIYANKQLLSEALDNLIENAISHAFKDFKGKKLIELIFMSWAEGDCINIEISNSGNPMPKNFTIERYVRMGDKAGKSNGSGFGGWYVNEIIKIHDGKLELERRDEDAEEFDIIQTNFSIELPVKEYIYEDKH